MLHRTHFVIQRADRFFFFLKLHFNATIYDIQILADSRQAVIDLNIIRLQVLEVSLIFIKVATEDLNP